MSAQIISRDCFSFSFKDFSQHFLSDEKLHNIQYIVILYCYIIPSHMISLFCLLMVVCSEHGNNEQISESRAALCRGMCSCSWAAVRTTHVPLWRLRITVSSSPWPDTQLFFLLFLPPLLLNRPPTSLPPLHLVFHNVSFMNFLSACACYILSEYYILPSEVETITNINFTISMN